MRKLYALFIAMFFITGCDVPGRLIISNRSGANAVYAYAIKDTHGGIKLVTDTLSPGNPKNKTTYLMGFGWRWTDEATRKYSESIQFIRITSKADTIELKDKQAVFNFLRTRRSGLAKVAVRVKIR